MNRFECFVWQVLYLKGLQFNLKNLAVRQHRKHKNTYELNYRKLTKLHHRWFVVYVIAMINDRTNVNVQHKSRLCNK